MYGNPFWVARKDSKYKPLKRNYLRAYGYCLVWKTVFGAQKDTGKAPELAKGSTNQGLRPQPSGPPEGDSRPKSPYMYVTVHV